MLQLLRNLFVEEGMKKCILLDVSRVLYFISRNKQLGHIPDCLVESHRKSELAKIYGMEVEQETSKRVLKEAPRDFRYVYPDFLPNPIPYFRDRIAEKLERADMLRRRHQIEIPEFYVGSIVAVSSSDPHAPGKENRFVGICIFRSGHGLRHFFILRNVIDNTGIEILYDMYNPCLQKIDVLRLEKRLDQHLLYLRDCPYEYSTFPFDMEAEKLPSNASTVPVNQIKVPLNPLPWTIRWELKNLRGVILPELAPSLKESVKKYSEPWLTYDLMKHYRKQIHDEDIDVIADDFAQQTLTKETKSGLTSGKKIKRSRSLPDASSSKQN